MMKKLLFLLAVSIGFTCSMLAQDVDINHPDSLQAEIMVPRLIFTEFNSQDPYRYIEITNLEDTAVSLENFRAGCFLNAPMYTRDAETGYITEGLFDAETRYWGQTNGRWYNTPGFGEDLIGPHESIVIATVFDRPLDEFNLDKTRHIKKLIDSCDYFVYVLESGTGLPYLNKPEDQAFGFDSVSNSSEYLRGNGPHALLYDYTRLDSLGDTITYSILVDQIALKEGEGLTGRAELEADWPVAGKTSHREWTLVRKSSVTQANLDWDDSRGTSESNSEWMCLPRLQGREPFTTIGNFGHFEMSVTPKSDKVTISGNVITVPWEAERGDGLIANWLQMGQGMGFQYTKNGKSADSAFVNVQEGDTLTLYVTGNTLRTEIYTFNVSDPTNDLAVVFPKIASNSLGYYANNPALLVSNEYLVDTVKNVPYQQVIDTLLAYIDYPSGATLEYVFLDEDDNRTELITGDRLKITSANGANEKEYFILTNVYEPSEDATLATISFPEYELDPDDYYWDWEDAELPGFNADNTFIVLKVSPTRSTVPALFALTSDRNASFEVDRAVNLVGTPQERTTTFTVTSESDSIVKVYKVEFQKDIDLSLVQAIEGATPFVSQAQRQPGGPRASDNYYSIYNPNSVPLDLSDYMLCSWNSATGTLEGTIQAAVGTDTVPDGGDCSYYIPGYKYDLAKWKAGEPGYFVKDANVTPVVDPNSEFTIATYHPLNPAKEADYAHLVDVNLYDTLIGDNWELDEYSPGNFRVRPNPKFTNLLKHSSTKGFVLLKILNDSIKAGTKIRADVADFEVVDMLHRPGEQDSMYTFYQTYGGGNSGLAFAGWFNADAAAELGVEQMLGQINYSSRVLLLRKSKVQTGAREFGEGYGWHPDSCDWEWAKGNWGSNYRWNPVDSVAEAWYIDDIRSTLKTHYMDPITYHLSTITSSVYKVSTGFETADNLKIDGVSGFPTLAQFLENINKADPGQELQLWRGETEITDENVVVVSDDILRVYSADASNTTDYSVIAEPLNGDVSLMAVPGLDITVEGDIVSGFGYDAKILDVLAGVKSHDLSVINVLDADGTPVALMNIRYDQDIDTTLEEPAPTYQFVETKVFDGLQFEVVAEDGSRKLYQLQAIMPTEDIFVTSNFFDVVETDSVRSIQRIYPGISASSFLGYLFAPGDAVIKLYNDAGYERTEGYVKWTDYVEVTSADGTLSAKYYLVFVGSDPDEVLKIVVPDDPTFVEQMPLAGSMAKLYPNPATDMVYLENAPENSVIQIISLSGSLVYSTSDVSDRMSIPTSQFDRGIYLVRIVEKGGSTVLKMILY